MLAATPQLLAAGCTGCDEENRSKILVLVSPGNHSVVSDAIDAGVDALYLKGAPIDQLANAIRIRHHNGMYRDPAISSISPALL